MVPLAPNYLTSQKFSYFSWNMYLLLHSPSIIVEFMFVKLVDTWIFIPIFYKSPCQKNVQIKYMSSSILFFYFFVLLCKWVKLTVLGQNIILAKINFIKNISFSVKIYIFFVLLHFLNSPLFFCAIFALSFLLLFLSFYFLGEPENAFSIFSGQIKNCNLHY